MLEIEKLGLVEMDSQEKKEVDGGWIVIVVGLAWSAWENIGDIREGWSDGINGKKARY